MFRIFFNLIKSTIYHIGAFICHPFQKNTYLTKVNYEKRLNTLIDLFQSEGKDYETSYDLAVNCLKKRSDGVKAYKKTIGKNYAPIVIIGVICTSLLAIYIF